MRISRGPSWCSILVPALAAVLLVGGCDDEDCNCDPVRDGAPVDRSPDVVPGDGVTTDSRPEVAIDGGAEVLADAGADVASDTTAPPDADPDAGADAEPDADSDAGVIDGGEPPPVPLPALVFRPTLVELGSVGVGGSAGSRVGLLNTSKTTSGPVTLMMWGPQAGAFVLLDNTCGPPLPPGAECAVQVRLEPTTAGDHQAVLSAAARPGGAAAALVHATVTSD